MSYTDEAVWGTAERGAKRGKKPEEKKIKKAKKGIDKQKDVKYNNKAVPQKAAADCTL